MLCAAKCWQSLFLKLRCIDLTSEAYVRASKEQVQPLRHEADQALEMVSDATDRLLTLITVVEH